MERQEQEYVELHTQKVNVVGLEESLAKHFGQEKAKRVSNWFRERGTTNIYIHAKKRLAFAILKDSSVVKLLDDDLTIDDILPKEKALEPASTRA